jgi:hypothetical protein
MRAYRNRKLDMRSYISNTHHVHVFYLPVS